MANFHGEPRLFLYLFWQQGFASAANGIGSRLKRPVVHLLPSIFCDFPSLELMRDEERYVRLLN
jgi:hypothetical protein